MAILKAGVANTSMYFNLDGLDYPKYGWELIYDHRELVAGVLDQEKLRVGLSKTTGT